MTAFVVSVLEIPYTLGRVSSLWLSLTFFRLADETKDTDKDDVHAVHGVLVVVQIDRVVCVHQDLPLLLPPPRVLQTDQGRYYSGVYIHLLVFFIYLTKPNIDLNISFL